MTASRDWLNRRLTPAARRLAWLHPNAVTVAALVIGLAAGPAYWLAGRHPVLYLVGGILVAISGLADGLDGVMARSSGRTTVMGDFLDHFFDRLVSIAIFVGLTSNPDTDLALGFVATVAVLLNSYLGTQIQASFGSRHYTGLGKAQLFTALTVVSVALALFPRAALRLGGVEAHLVDLFFILVILGTLHAMGHRLRLAARLASGDGRGSEDGG